MKKLFCLVAIPFLLSCAGSPKKFDPDHMNSEQGAVMGKISVSNQGQDITKKCYVHFRDESDNKKVALSLDETGWIFTNISSGKTYIGLIACKIQQMPLKMAQLETKKLKLMINGEEGITYFGHMKIDLNVEPSNASTSMILLGGLGGAMAAKADNDQNSVTIQVNDELTEAQRELEPQFSGIGKYKFSNQSKTVFTKVD